jgi:hypothetical protein
MISFGKAPILECSSKGDRRFSAFFARIRFRNNKSIEELYQARKLFEGNVQGLSVQDAKGKLPINIEDCRSFYSQLWNEYFDENPDLLLAISQYNGFSDIFGQPGRACQAEEIYRIAKERLIGYV